MCIHHLQGGRAAEAKAEACDAELISKDVETLLAKVLILCLSLNLLSLEAQVETEETRN